jgi:hypothetical protein
MGRISPNNSPNNSPTKVQSSSSSSSAMIDNNMISNNVMMNNSGSTITTAKSSIATNETTIDLNDLRLSDHNTQHTDNSFGNSSLSSFLSVLLEDEESSEFLIVQDNPKVASEQRSIRDLRVVFSSNNMETKSRWDYLVREDSDNDLLFRSSRRSRRSSMMTPKQHTTKEIRSSSFSDAIPSTTMKKPERRGKASNDGRVYDSDSITVSPGNNSSTKCNSNSNRFLRMPRRQRSPTEIEIGKKSLYNRLNQSDSDLLDTRIPMSRLPRGSDGRNNNNNFYSAASLGGRGYGERRLKRSSTHEKSQANASWSKADLRAKRNEEHNRFFDIMMEPDGDAAAGGASPVTNSLSSLQSSSSSAFQESMLNIINNNDNNNMNNSIGELLVPPSSHNDDVDVDVDNDNDNDNDNSLQSSSSSVFQESMLIHNDSMEELTLLSCHSNNDNNNNSDNDNNDKDSKISSTKKAHHKKKKKSSSSRNMKSPPPPE